MGQGPSQAEGMGKGPRTLESKRDQDLDDLCPKDGSSTSNGSTNQEAPSSTVYKAEGTSDGATVKSTADAAMLLLLLSNVLDILSLSVTLPALPTLYLSMGIKTTYQGYILSASSALAFISGPVLGRWSDVYGRKLMLKVSAIGSLVGWICCMLAPNAALFALARVLPGITKCSIPVSQAYISDLSGDGDRAKNLGLLGASFGIGFVIGPLIGGMLAAYNPSYTMFVAALAGVLNIIIISAMKESNPKDSPTGSSKGSSNKAEVSNSMLSVFTGENRWEAILLFHNKFIFMVPEMFFQSTFTAHATENLGLKGGGIGMVLSYAGVVSTLSNVFGVRALTARFSDSTLLLTCCLLQGTMHLAWGMVSNFWVLAGVLALKALLSTTFLTLLTSQVSQIFSKDMVGAAMGAYSAIDTVVRVIIPPLAGYIFDQYGNLWVGITACIAVLYCAACVFGQRWLNSSKSQKTKIE